MRSSIRGPDWVVNDLRLLSRGTLPEAVRSHPSGSFFFIPAALFSSPIAHLSLQTDSHDQARTGPDGEPADSPQRNISSQSVSQSASVP